MFAFKAFIRVAVVGAALLAFPLQASAQVNPLSMLGGAGGLGSLSSLSSLLPILGIGTAPPQMPAEGPPPAPPGPGQQYTPGYWGYGQGGYSWVPGTYQQPPQPGAQWTPGYWANSNGAYNWTPGYWGNEVGYYGGVNYGGGYTGTGYNPGAINVPRPAHLASYNGPGGVVMNPTPAQLEYSHAKHIAMTQTQQAHIREAEADRNNLATVNGGKPPMLASQKPFSAKNPPKNFKPITKADRDKAPKQLAKQNQKNGGKNGQQNAGKQNQKNGGKNGQQNGGKQNQKNGGKNGHQNGGKNGHQNGGKNGQQNGGKQNGKQQQQPQGNGKQNKGDGKAKSPQGKPSAHPNG